MIEVISNFIIAISTVIAWLLIICAGLFVLLLIVVVIEEVLKSGRKR